MDMQDSPETPPMSDQSAGVPDEIDLPDEVLIAMWDEAAPVEVISPPTAVLHSRWLRTRSRTARQGFSVHASQRHSIMAMASRSRLQQGVHPSEPSPSRTTG